MDTNKMREQFEAAFVEEQVRLCGEGFRDSALYMIQENLVTVRSAWWAWQASREAVVVELPDVANYEVYDQQHDFLHTDEVTLMEAVGAAIEAQGLKVKP